MATKLIKLNDGTLIEVEVVGAQVEPISGGLAAKVKSSFDDIRPTLVNIATSMSDTWKELSKNLNLERAEVEIGLSFEAEGNVFVTKAKAGANLTLKLILKSDAANVPGSLQS